MTVAFYRWPDLSAGARARGPAVITGAEATAVVPPGCTFQIDGHGNVVITIRPKAKGHGPK
jgi:N-methylhydantoinase A/oxoprolinase/acetone carboxylase beta subunit